MKPTFRCVCPVTSALDILGDKWTLVIVKQMLVENKQTFKDFFESDEAIATNILASRLKMLEKTGIITKHKRTDNKKTNIYVLTERGLSLATIIVELLFWGDENLRDFNKNMIHIEDLQIGMKNKQELVDYLIEIYKKNKARLELSLV